MGAEAANQAAKLKLEKIKEQWRKTPTIKSPTPEVSSPPVVEGLLQVAVAEEQKSKLKVRFSTDIDEMKEEEDKSSVTTMFSQCPCSHCRRSSGKDVTDIYGTIKKSEEKEKIEDTSHNN